MINTTGIVLLLAGEQIALNVDGQAAGSGQDTYFVSNTMDKQLLSSQPVNIDVNRSV